MISQLQKNEILQLQNIIVSEAKFTCRTKSKTPNPLTLEKSISLSLKPMKTPQIHR
jgi:hypothetical protein